jgi:UDP-N-acetylglucosamine transferase subunit ALG13
VILVTTGTQLPFPRLVAAMDRLAPVLGERVVAQVGPDAGNYANLETHARLDPETFEALFREARLVVAHAGIGTVLAACRHGKPLVLMPRRHSLGEHRNDHQMATAEALRGRVGLYLARDEDELAEHLTRRGTLAPMREELGPAADALNGFIAGWLAGR